MTTNNSAIPATVEIDGETFPAHHDTIARIQFRDYHRLPESLKRRYIQEDVAPTLVAIKALPPAAQVEVIKELAQGLAVAVVPREPTEAMLMAFDNGTQGEGDAVRTENLINGYRAMLQADSQRER